MKHPMSGYAALLGLAVLAATPCAADETPMGETIVSTAWRAVSIDGAAPGEGIAIDLRIEDDGATAGSAGCNRYTTHATINGGSIAFAPAATTRMMCDEARMKAEAAFLGALEATRRFSFDPAAGELFLHDDDGSTLAFFVRE